MGKFTGAILRYCSTGNQKEVMILEEGNKPGILHMIDSLDLGGAERMAVSLVNHLSQGDFKVFLCTTRREGSLKESISSNVGYMCLFRKRIVDFKALRKLYRFIQEHEIQIIHAHSSSLFLGAMVVALIPRHVKLIWHDHFGLSDIKIRNPLLYRLALKNSQAVIAVNLQLVEWARKKVGVKNVYYIPNFAETSCDVDENLDLPGLPDSRIVCVANFKPEKDLIMLLKAMRLVVSSNPFAHLILIGAPINIEYSKIIQSMIVELNLQNRVTWLGIRKDVPQVLKQCAIGVLSSRSEGLPVTLLEYGTANLAVVATDVGQCRDLILDGKTGFLVKAGDYNKFSEAILDLLQTPDIRVKFGTNLIELIQSKFSAKEILLQVENIYKFVLEKA